MDYIIKTDPVALYAAAIATAVLIWDAVKWWTEGVRLRSYTGSNMILVGGGTPSSDRFIVLHVINRGTAPTNLHGILIYAFPSFWSRVRRKPNKAAIVNDASVTSRLPCDLVPGRRFTATILQTDELIGWSRHYWLYLGIDHTMGNRPSLVRVRPIQN